MLRVQSGTEVLNCVAVQYFLLRPRLVDSFQPYSSLISSTWKEEGKRKTGHPQQEEAGAYDVSGKNHHEHFHSSFSTTLGFMV